MQNARPTLTNSLATTIEILFLQGWAVRRIAARVGIRHREISAMLVERGHESEVVHSQTWRSN